MSDPAPTGITIEQALGQASAHWNAGQADQAERLCQHVLAIWPGQSDAQVRAQWQPYARALPAVKNGHVLVLDADALYRPGPRLLDAAEVLCAAIANIRTTATP